MKLFTYLHICMYACILSNNLTPYYFCDSFKVVGDWINGVQINDKDLWPIHKHEHCPPMMCLFPYCLQNRDIYLYTSYKENITTLVGPIDYPLYKKKYIWTSATRHKRERRITFTWLDVSLSRSLLLTFPGHCITRICHKINHFMVIR